MNTPRETKKNYTRTNYIKNYLPYMIAFCSGAHSYEATPKLFGQQRLCFNQRRPSGV